MEVANVRDRFAADEDKVYAMLQRLAAEERKHSIPVGAIEWRTDGIPSPAGYRKRLPSEHELPRFFRMPELIEFFEQIKTDPNQRAICDLHNAGYTVVFTYIPRSGSGPFGRSGGSVVSDVPTAVTEHSVYRVLRQKARKYSKARDGAPLVVCLGSEDSRPLSSWQSHNAVSLDKAVMTAFEEYRSLSLVIIVSVESNNSISNYGRVARVRSFVNRSASCALGPLVVEFLKQLDFNAVEYGAAWNEWDGHDTIAERRRRLGGGLRIGGSDIVNEGSMVELPVEVILQMLAGAMSSDEFVKDYRLDEFSGPADPNPFRRAWEDGRQLVAVTLTSANPRAREGARLRFDFGPPQEMLLQVPQHRARDARG
jgi:uncharacterized protein (DUF433 family)